MDEYIDSIKEFYKVELSVHTSFYMTCAGLLAMQFVVDLLASYAAYISKCSFTCPLE